MRSLLVHTTSSSLLCSSCVTVVAGTKLLGCVADRELDLHGNPHLRRVHLGDRVHGQDQNGLLPFYLIRCVLVQAARFIIPHVSMGA